MAVRLRAAGAVVAGASEAADAPERGCGVQQGRPSARRPGSATGRPAGSPRHARTGGTHRPRGGVAGAVAVASWAVADRNARRPGGSAASRARPYAPSACDTV
ncbi:hypothetical protein JS756_17260 [Streptomyces actuosus]|uniref:Uncharacterized protein n=1 Tax=Streptomyces actuosus TaxID=1885 RepID=A0ABS2VRX4_STRAS|nr:hypothetical protein [Streptomyces actuosus]MBN0045821.1 hypothetical protein [Streptomyces actuosus]